MRETDAFEYAWRLRRNSCVTINNHKKQSDHEQKPLIEFNLTYEQALAQLERQDYCCYYTGRKLSKKRLTINKKLKRHNFNPSIDRIDSNKGYTPDNIVWTLSAVNYMKGELSVVDFMTLVAEICANTIR